MFNYRPVAGGAIVRPSTVLKDQDGRPFVFVGPCPDDPYWILGMTPESIGALMCTDTEEITVRKRAADFALTPELESTDAYVWFIGDEVNVATTDGRSVAVNPSGQITVWSRDRMHGARFTIPPGAEWSSVVTLPCEHVSVNWGNVSEDRVGLFIACAQSGCFAKFLGLHITDPIAEIRKIARGHGWGSLNGKDYCPKHGGREYQ
jgi:hypothetical protein